MSLLDTLNGAWGTVGPCMQKACVAFAAHTGAAHALITYSGTAALEAVLRAFVADASDAKILMQAQDDPRVASVIKAVGADVLYTQNDVHPPVGEPPERICAVIVTAHGNAVPDLSAFARVYGAQKLIVWFPDGVAALSPGSFTAAVYDLGAANPLNIGAGALTVNDAGLYSRIFAYHNCGRPFGARETLTFDAPIIGGDLRVAEFPCALLLDALHSQSPLVPSVTA